MILLQIHKAVKFKPQVWIEGGASMKNDGQTFSQFVGDHPTQPEQGSVEIEVGLLEGSFDDITELLFISMDPLAGKLIGYHEMSPGIYSIDVSFDNVFRHGLEYMTSQFIQQDHGIIGLTQEDKTSLTTFDGQGNLLSLLLYLIMPDRHDEILELMEPGLLVIPNEMHDESSSHLGGIAKYEMHTRAPTTDDGIVLMHLATIRTRDLKLLSLPSAMKDYISFYIRIDNTTERWPVSPDEFKVLHYNQLTSEKPIDGDATSAFNFSLLQLLDLPRYDHIMLQLLDLSEEEKEQYEVVESLYKTLVIPSYEWTSYNKICGYPDNVQYCVAFEAEMIKNKRSYTDQIPVEAAEWKLLFQVSPYCKWLPFFDTFGDGSIYYMIRKKDFERGDFSDVQVVVQNT